MHWTTAVSEEKMSQSTANTHSVFVTALSRPTCLLLTLRPAWQIKIRAPSSVGPPAPWLSPGRRSSCNGRRRGFCSEHVGVRAARELWSSWQNKSSWSDRSCWEGFSLCLWWGAVITVKEWLVMPVCVFAQKQFFKGTMGPCRFVWNVTQGEKMIYLQGQTRIYQIPGWNCRNINRSIHYNSFSHIQQVNWFNVSRTTMKKRHIL